MCTVREQVLIIRYKALCDDMVLSFATHSNSICRGSAVHWYLEFQRASMAICWLCQAVRRRPQLLRHSWTADCRQSGNRNHCHLPGGTQLASCQANRGYQEPKMTWRDHEGICLSSNRVHCYHWHQGGTLQVLLMFGPEFARSKGTGALEPLGIYLPGDINYPGILTSRNIIQCDNPFLSFKHLASFLQACRSLIFAYTVASSCFWLFAQTSLAEGALDKNSCLNAYWPSEVMQLCINVASFSPRWCFWPLRPIRWSRIFWGSQSEGNEERTISNG